MVSRFMSPWIVSLALVGFCASCGYGPIQERKEYPEIQAGKRSVLLLRVTSELPNGKPVGNAFSKAMDGGFGLGGFETGGEVKLTIPGRSIFFLSNETAHQGWVYFILKPGAYYLAFLGPRTTNLFSYSAALKSAQRWRIEIPEGSRLIYGGTVHLLCRKFKFLFTSCAQARQIGVLKNEESLAAKLASEHLPELGAPKTLLLEPHRGPIIIKSLSKEKPGLD